jgi:hypothetical protein
MPCIPFKGPDGVSGFICTRGRASATRAALQGAVTGATVKTCSRAESTIIFAVPFEGMVGVRLKPRGRAVSVVSLFPA